MQQLWVFNALKQIRLMRYNVNSRFMVCADYDSYIACQAQVEQVYMVSLKVLRCTALTVA